MVVCCPYKCPFPDILTASIHSGTCGNPAGANLVGMERREYSIRDYIGVCPEVFNPHICSPAELAESVKFNTKRMPCTAGGRSVWAIRIDHAWVSGYDVSHCLMSCTRDFN